MPAATSHAPTPPIPGAALARLALGPEPDQQRAIKRLLLATQGYCVLYVLMAVVAGLGLSPWRETGIFIGYGLAGAVLFYVLIRSGITMRWHDPMLSVPQVAFGIGLVVLGYALLPFTHGTMFQLLFVLLAFDLQRLTPYQTRLTATSAVALLALTLGGLSLFTPHSVDLRQEVMNMGMSAFFIPVLLVVGRAARQIQARQNEQRSELANALGQLELLSRHDALTNAVNRRHMTVLLNEEVSRQHRTGNGFSLAVIDVDHFKRVNDSHGHAVGDQVLCEITRLAKAQLRETDVVARWGGEEFLMLMPDTSAREALDALQRLRVRVQTHDWSQFAPGLRVTFSGGISTHDLSVGLQQTVASADAALYRAKERGRNRVEQA